MWVVTGSPLTPALSRGGERGQEAVPYIPMVTYKVGASVAIAGVSAASKGLKSRRCLSFLCRLGKLIS